MNKHVSMPGSIFKPLLRAGSFPRRKSTILPISTLQVPDDPSINDVECVSDHPDASVDIVCVHGLTGRSFETWGSRDVLQSWLTFIPDEIPRACVFACGFNAIEHAKKNSMGFRSDCRELFKKLEVMRKSSRPIVLVAHSMGGLILRAALFEDSMVDFRSSVTAMVFLGTPNFTTDDHWQDFGHNMSQTMGCDYTLQGVEARLFKEINSEFLQFYVHKRKQVGMPDIRCLYETLPTFDVGVIVPREQAVLPGYEETPLYADHCNLSKFESVWDEQYQKLAKHLRSVAPTYQDPIFHRASHGLRDPQPVMSYPLLNRRKELRSIPINDWNVEPLKLAEEATSYAQNSEVDKAMEWYGRAMDLCRAEMPACYRIYCFCADRISEQSLRQGYYSTAHDSSKRSMDAWAKYRADNSLGMLDTATIRAKVLRYTAQNSEAYDVLRDALANVTTNTYLSVVGIIALSMLAKVLKDLGCYSVCELLTRNVIGACHQHRDIGAHHIFTYERISDLGVLLSRTKRFTASEKILEYAVQRPEKSLSELHPHILRTKRRLGGCLRFQGRTDEAQRLLEHALTLHQKVFGIKHPHTLATMWSLAGVYALQNRLKDCRALLKTTTCNRTELLKEEHPDTKWTIVAQRAVEGILDHPPYDNRAFMKHLQRIRAIFSLPANATNSAGPFDLPTYDITRFGDLTDSASQFDLVTYDQARFDDLIQEVIELRRLDHGEKILGGKVLRAAAATGKIDEIQHLLERGFDPGVTGGFWGSALQAASFADERKCVKLLLEKGAEVNENTGVFGSAIRAASLKGNADVVTRLLQHGADLRSEMGTTPLHIAVMSNDHTVAEMLLKNGRAFGDSHDVLFGTPLQEAAWKGYGTMVELLLKHGADPSDNHGAFGNALELAASAGHINIVKLLFSGPKRPSDATSLTALAAALQAGKTKSAASIIDHCGNDHNRAQIARILLASNFSDETMAHLLYERQSSETIRGESTDTGNELPVEFGPTGKSAPGESSDAADVKANRGRSTTLSTVSDAASVVSRSTARSRRISELSDSSHEGPSRHRHKKRREDEPDQMQADGAEISHKRSETEPIRTTPLTGWTFSPKLLTLPFRTKTYTSTIPKKMRRLLRANTWHVGPGGPSKFKSDAPNVS